MESLVERMQDEKEGVPIKNAKSFMSKQPSVFTGADLTQWLIKSYDIDESGSTTCCLLFRTIRNLAVANNWLTIRSAMGI